MARKQREASGKEKKYLVVRPWYDETGKKNAVDDVVEFDPADIPKLVKNRIRLFNGKEAEAAPAPAPVTPPPAP